MERLIARIRRRLATNLWSSRLTYQLGTLVACLIFTCSVSAIGPTLAHMNHAVWTSKEGLPASIRVMAQTPDGWLWLGTTAGLYRFDGLRFHPITASNGERLLSNRISALKAESNGDLYIGYEDFGLSVLHADGRLEHLAPADSESPVTRTYTILRDTDGTVWAGTSRGLIHFEHGRWTRIGAEHGYPDGLAFSLLLDGGSQLWAANLTHLFKYEREARRFIPIDLPVRRPDEKTLRLSALVMSPDGRLWFADPTNFVSVLAAASAGERPMHANAFTGSHHGLFDRDGHLWALRCPSGICLAAGASADKSTRVDLAVASTSRLDQSWQLGSLSHQVMLEDLEGNIWLGSKRSLERFRKNSLTPVDLPPTTGSHHIAPGSDGSVWIVSPLSSRGWRYDTSRRQITELRGKYRGAARSADGTVVLLKEDGILRRRAGIEDLIDLPLLPRGAWVRTDGERIWLGGASTPVRTWDGREWQTLANPKPDEFTFTQAGRQGQMWRGLVDGRLLLFEKGRIAKEIDQAALGAIGQFTCLSAIPELVVCGENSVSAWDGRRFRRLHTTDADLLRNVSGMLVTSDGTRWLNGRAGLLRVDAADWRRSLGTGAPLRATLLDALDGYLGSAADGPSLTMVGNRLWVDTMGGIVEIDPAARQRNLYAPQVALLGLNGDGTMYSLAAPLIRAGTTRLRFDFTAPSLRKPERVVFNYRLDGVDEAWQTSKERSATYTKLAPGSYVFRVRAMNEDGVWSKRERTLAFQVAPTIVQTVSFKLACGVVTLIVLWIGHRLRLRYLTRSLNFRHQVQLEERSRIARELHDSLLQKFQGAVLDMKGALRGLGSGSPLYERLQTGVHEANAAIAEGREKVEALRGSGSGQPCLLDYLRQVGESEAKSGQHFALKVEGVVRPLQPVVEQELCAIGREALRNAFHHAGACRHEVQVEFGPGSLVLRVRDNGCGIDAAAREKTGHWGVRGIEERARLIHADASLVTAPGGGTQWRIEVMAKLAYAKSERHRRWWGSEGAKRSWFI